MMDFERLLVVIALEHGIRKKGSLEHEKSRRNCLCLGMLAGLWMVCWVWFVRGPRWRSGLGMEVQLTIAIQQFQTSARGSVFDDDPCPRISGPE